MYLLDFIKLRWLLFRAISIIGNRVLGCRMGAKVSFLGALSSDMFGEERAKWTAWLPGFGFGHVRT